MDVLTSETIWAVNWRNKASDIKLVYLYSNYNIFTWNVLFGYTHSNGNLFLEDDDVTIFIINNIYVDFTLCHNTAFRKYQVN